MAHQPLVPARVLRRAVAVGATVAAAFVTHASGAPVPVVPAQSGLTEPGALVRTPDAALWTTSPEIGVCRISPGATPRPIEGTFCGDELRQGPKEPLGMAFDRRSSSFFVADGGSNSGGVWRMHWNPATATIDAAVRIAHLGEDRATGLTLAPTGPIGSDGKHANEVYLTTKGSTAVLRIADPQGAAAAPAVAGHARGAGATSLAVLDGDLYIAENIEPDDDDPTFPPPIVATNGVSRLSLASGTTGGGNAVAVPGLDGGLSHAVATDPVRGRVYMGTATGDLVDHVDVLDVDSGRVETYETGFTHVTSMGVEDDGDLLVADDPGAGALVVDSFGMGRIWRVGLQTLDRPAPAITSGPRGHEQPHARILRVHVAGGHPLRVPPRRRGLRGLPGDGLRHGLLRRAVRGGPRLRRARARSGAGIDPGALGAPDLHRRPDGAVGHDRLPSRRRAAPRRGDPARVLGG